MYPTPVLEHGYHCGNADGMVMPLKEVRKRAKLSQEALGHMVGSGRSTIVKLEDGTLPLKMAWAKRLAPALDCHPFDLYEPAPLPSEEELEEMMTDAALEVPPGASSSVWIHSVAASLREQLKQFVVDRSDPD